MGQPFWRQCNDRLRLRVRQLLFGLPAAARLPVVGLVYSGGLVASLGLAYLIRFDFVLPEPEQQQLWRHCLWLVPVKLAMLLLIGQFSRLLSYFSIPDLRRISLALANATAVGAVIWVLTDGAGAPPRSVLAADFVLSLVAVGGIRLGFRRARELFLETPLGADGRVLRVGIMGAGDAGVALARELTAKRRFGMRPVLFLDDDPQKWDSRLHGLPVIGGPEILSSEAERWHLDKVIIAMPAAPKRRIQEVVVMVRAAHLPCEIVPSLGQLASGQVQVSQLRPVEIEDLLGREPVQLATGEIRKLIEERVVLVTGAGGSIGSELCRQIAGYRPARLLLLEQSEGQIFRIQQELLQRGYGRLVLPLIGNVLDRGRLRAIFAENQPDLVFHAAAHKHVPLMETHPGEAIKNNLFGTIQTASLALEFGAERFVFISTDKAINPTSVMGATKRMAEMFLQSLAANQLPRPEPGPIRPLGLSARLPSLPVERTKFLAVRFGNVLGSSGSVVPIFKEQIAAGGPVTVTHPEMTRYFMTIPEAVGLVLQSATQGEGGEIFVLDMGKPVKIVDLARQLIELSGLRPGEDIEIRFTGLRPGEKLYEELSYVGEAVRPTKHPKIMRFVSRPPPFALVQQHLHCLENGLSAADSSRLKQLIQQVVPEYQPDLPATTTLWPPTVGLAA